MAEEQKVDEQKVEERKYSLEGVAFESLETWVRILKCDTDLNFDKDILPYFLTPHIIEELKEMWADDEKYPKMTIAEILKTSNQSHKLVMFNYVGFDKIATELNAKVIDTQTIPRTLERKKVNPNAVKIDGARPTVNVLSEDMFTVSTETYDDVYETLRVEGKLVDLDEDLFLLHVVCPSTKGDYYLPITEEHVDDAIGAVAWTEYITKEEYMKLEYQS